MAPQHEDFITVLSGGASQQWALAIGIVVDDAIVIVENASHHMEKGMSPRAATIQAMSEVTGPVIAITLVLMAVFLLTAFLPGITGQMYRQFALTIAATASISAINALTLKPAQCAMYLRSAKKPGWYARAFEAGYRPIERGYAWTVRKLLRVWPLVLLAFLGFAAFTGWLYQRTPTGFLPTEDQGWVMIAVQLPDSASGDRGGPHALSPDHHDEFRVHPRCGAAGVCHGRWGREPAIARHRGLRWYDYLDGASDFCSSPRSTSRFNT